MQPHLHRQRHNITPSSTNPFLSPPSTPPSTPTSPSLNTVVVPTPSETSPLASGILGDNSNLNSHALTNALTSTFPVTSLPVSRLPNSSPTTLSTGMSSICIGQGLDAPAQGLIAAFVLPTLIGLAIWLIFAVARPHFRQVYALREWFVHPYLRPKPLSSSLFAFLSPHVPLVPPIPQDVSDTGKSVEHDAHLFPSDEQLSQRSLWVGLHLVLGWSILGLCAGLPLYLVDLPCVAQSAPPSATTIGSFSTLQDLSLLRLLKLLDDNTITTTASFNSLFKRATVDGQDVVWKARLRIIILTAIVVSLGVVVPLYRILKEFNLLVAYHKRFAEVRCQGLEMGWLSARKAPGFKGWGERRLKDFIMKAGLSGSLDGNANANNRNGANGYANGHSRNNHNGTMPNRVSTRRSRMLEDGKVEVDVHSLFTIGDTHNLAMLIDERDEILENLEVAEAKYIQSFRLTTPDPSIADLPTHLTNPSQSGRPHISRPLPLNGNRSRTVKRKRSLNPAFAASSLAPTNFVAPSSYYMLHNIRGISGSGRLASLHNSQVSFSEAFHSRVIGSRFQEVNRNSVAFGKLPMGSFVRVEKTGQLGPRESMVLQDAYQNYPDPRLYGPNYEEEIIGGVSGEVVPEGEEWVNVVPSPNEFGEFASEQNGVPAHRPFKIRAPSSRRETFPLRGRDAQGQMTPDDVLPPHLRVQHSAPFVRPMSGIDFDGLGDVYAQIRMWRSQLKVINNEISDAQSEGYRQIAEGVKVKGWLLVGRGLRHIHGVEIIEGRAKEDIRWDVLQNERDRFDSVIVWSIVIVAAVLLAAGLTAVTGLALSSAPDFAYYLPFLRVIEQRNDLAGGLATVLTPAVAAVLFTTAAIWIVRWVSTVHGAASISGTQLLAFKSVFALIFLIACIFFVGIGAVLFALGAYSRTYDETATIADGAIYIAVLVLAVVLTIAIIVPGLLILQPIRLMKVLKEEKRAITPRQRFRAVYPRNYDPTYTIAACISAIVFASAFAVVFPLIGPAVFVLILLSLVAHRYLIGYVYGRTHSQSGGVLQIWLYKRFGTIIALQPLLLGLLLLSRSLWEEGGVLIGTAVLVVIFVEVYCTLKSKLPGTTSLSGITQDCLEYFMLKARNQSVAGEDSDGERSLIGDAGSGAGHARSRGSFASVLEMMSLTLAVMPSPSKSRGPVPLQTETLNDLTATERAARTHPDAPPHLPPLPFTDHAEEMAGILYAPELIAPPPIIWLPYDSAGVARSEAVDLQRYHDLNCTLDVRGKDDVMRRERTMSTRSNR